MDTLLLAQDSWDLVLDINGNLAVAAAPYAIAQDVASACRVLRGDIWYDANAGLANVFGKAPNLQAVRQQVEAAALTVPGVTNARCVLASFRDRILTGQVQVTDNSGTAQLINF